MPSTLHPPPSTRIYLLRESALILLWAYVILVAGSVTGLINFRVQAATAILSAVVIGAWLIFRAFQRREIPPSGIEWAWSVFLAAQFVAALLSEDVRRSLPVVAQFTAYALVFYCALDLTRSGWPAELIEKTLLTVGAIVVGLALVELGRLYLGWRALTAGLPFAPGFAYRLYAVFGEANLTAAFLNVLMPLAIARVLASRSWLLGILLGTLIVGALVVEYFTSSRAGVLGAATALGVLGAAWIGHVSP
ncbi:MAG: hypothetical protein HY260_12710 [Chloroflexi bacterium]|nr:hypothetical protein [Chloroflexota bacterium]